MSKIRSKVPIQPGDLLALPVTCEANIPDSYRDEMGHMNVMWYTHLFSQSTCGFLELIGIDQPYFEQNDRGTFALEAHIQYLAEVRIDMRVEVRTQAVGRSDKRFHLMHYLIVLDDDILASTGEFVGAHIDMQTRRMSAFPEIVQAPLDRLIREHSSVEFDVPLCGIMRP